MIEIRGLTKFFDSRAVLKGIDFKFKAGRVTGIIGPNACGKSTFMKCLLGHVIPSSGEIKIDGRSLDPDGEFRRKIGFMPQAPIFPKHLCLTELLNMLEELRGEPAPSREELISYFELQSVAHQPFQELSGGTRQKVATVIAFMFNSPIIILDEPTGGFDPIASGRFKELVLRRARQGATILLVSHLIAEIEQMVDDIAFMNDGVIAFSGSPADLLGRTQAVNLEQAVIRLLEEKAVGFQR